MTSTENYLALFLIKENYGDTAHLIANHLIKKKSYPLILLASDLNLDKKTISQTLTIMLLHNLIDYNLNSKKMIEYKLCTKNVLNLLKISRNIAKAHELYGLVSGLIVEQFSLHGSLQMSSCILKILKTNSNTIQNDQLHNFLTQIKECFTNLVNLNHVERLADLDDSSYDSKVPKFNFEIDKYSIPELHFDDLKILIEQDIEKKQNNDQDYGDKGVYWRLNYKKFLQIYRDDVLVQAVRNRIDQNAANIIGLILRISDSKIESEKATQFNNTSKTVTSIDIQKHMRNEYQMDSITLEKYLTVIQQDSFKILEKKEEYGGGAYVIDFKKSLESLCVAHIESVVRERYGSKSLRIFRVIMEKSQLEQKQIEDFSMIPSKDCKALLYAMLNDGMLCITELSKTTDHAPSRTYYLFYVDVYLICKKLLENAYKSMANLMIKREYLTNENKRLIEKNKKVNTIIESLIAQGSEQAEIDEVKSIISNEELRMLNSFNDHRKRLELAEIQLEEMINLFELYFYYHTVAPIITTGRTKK